MVLHTFGDSHSNSGWNSIPGVQIHHLGAKLCFSVGRDGIDIKNGYGVQEGDTVVFCFGEIDCRCHVHKHITQNKDYKSIIDYIVEKYFEKIRIAVDKFKSLKVGVYNVVPPVEKRNTPENPDYPYLGTDDERKQYVLYFNKKLEEKCAEFGYTYVNIYNSYIDANGFLDKTLSDGNVHIRYSGYLEAFLHHYL